MANPSLQIGNGKFAIKENELLGYSSSGTRFFPIPITMTRATLGSRVNSSGLIEDVELLGSEEVSCGNFECANPDGVWNRGSGWEIENGKATASPATDYLYQDNVYDHTTVKTYKLTYDITVEDGTFKFLILGKTGPSFFGDETTSGTYTIYFTTTGSSGDGRLYIAYQGNFDGDVNSVSVKEATIDGLARVDYTDGTASLLVEPQRTNLITYSEDFSQSIYQKFNLTPLPNTIISPDGKINSTTFTKPTSGVPRLFLLNIYPSTGVYTFSVFIKNIDSDSILLRLDADNNTANCDINLSNNTLVNTGSNIISSNLTEFANGWIRVSVTANITSTALKIDALNMFNSTVGTSVAVWGAQLEQASYPTSYIKTTGSSVTRNQDLYTKTGISDLINSTEGVFFAEFSVFDIATNSKAISLVKSSSPTSNAVILYYNGNRIAFDILNPSGTVSVTTNITNALQLNKVALKYKSGDIALWFNGVEIVTRTNTISLSGLDELQFDFTTGNGLYGKIKQLQVFKTALSDSELATLTT